MLYCIVLIIKMEFERQKEAGTMTEPEQEPAPSLEQLLATRLAARNLTTSQVKKTIRAVVDQLYKPPWKPV